MPRNKFSLLNTILFAAAFSTVLSFYPVVAVGDVFEKAFYILWFVLLYLLFQQNKKVFVDKNDIWMALVYAGCFMATKIAIRIGDYPYKSTIGLARHIPYCLFFYFVGNNLCADKEKQLVFLRAVVFGAVFTSVATLIGGGLALQKNQLGQVLGVAVFCTVIQFNHSEHIGEKVLCALACTICAVALWTIQSRTPLICGVIVLLAIYTTRKKERNHHFKSALVFILALVAFFTAAELHLLDGVLRSFYPDYGRYVTISEALHSKKAMDILLSGRLTVYEIAISDFKTHPLFGVGPWGYIDNFVFHCLRSGGIVYAVLILPLVYGIMFRTPAQLRKIKPKTASEAIYLSKDIIGATAMFYFLESMMEGYPPVGPGASSFFLWLMLGIGNRLLPRHKMTSAENEQ